MTSMTHKNSDEMSGLDCASPCPLTLAIASKVYIQEGILYLYINKSILFILLFISTFSFHLSSISFSTDHALDLNIVSFLLIKRPHLHQGL